MRVKVTINQAVWERTTGYAEIPDDIPEDEWPDTILSDYDFWEKATNEILDSVSGFDAEYTFERSE